MKGENDNNKTIGSDKETGNEVMKPHYGRAKQSWPLFRIFGFLGSCLFIFAGISLVIGFLEEKDSGMLYVGIFFLMLGLGLLIGVIGTIYSCAIGKGKDDTDLSITVDIDHALNKNKYSAENLVRNVNNGRNNVATINTKDGFFRFYGYKGSFIAEIRIGSEENFSTYHLIDPNQMDDTVTVLENLFLERFPTRKNRIVPNGMVVSAVQKLYETQSLDQMVYCFSNVDTTAETKNLIMKGAYITPEAPIVIVSPTSEEGKKKAIKEQMAMQELQKDR